MAKDNYYMYICIQMYVVLISVFCGQQLQMGKRHVLHNDHDECLFIFDSLVQKII